MIGPIEPAPNRRMPPRGAAPPPQGVPPTTNLGNHVLRNNYSPNRPHQARGYYHRRIASGTAQGAPIAAAAAAAPPLLPPVRRNMGNPIPQREPNWRPRGGGHRQQRSTAASSISIPVQISGFATIQLDPNGAITGQPTRKSSPSPRKLATAKRRQCESVNSKACRNSQSNQRTYITLV